MYTCAYVYDGHLTCGLVNVSYRYLTALCFHENCQLVVIVSCVWAETVLLCFCGATHIGESLHYGATKVSHHSHGYGHPVLWLRCALQPFGTKTLSQAYPLVRINPR